MHSLLKFDAVYLNKKSIIRKNKKGHYVLLKCVEIIVLLERGLEVSYQTNSYFF